MRVEDIFCCCKPIINFLKKNKTEKVKEINKDIKNSDEVLNNITSKKNEPDVRYNTNPINTNDAPPFKPNLGSKKNSKRTLFHNQINPWIRANNLKRPPKKTSLEYQQLDKLPGLQTKIGTFCIPNSKKTGLKKNKLSPKKRIIPETCSKEDVSKEEIIKHIKKLVNKIVNRAKKTDYQNFSFKIIVWELNSLNKRYKDNDEWNYKNIHTVTKQVASSVMEALKELKSLQEYSQ
ncbi:hypothetical protein ACFLZV_01775 [Candidatus Margulisiibacteriota bacterium]